MHRAPRLVLAALAALLLLPAAGSAKGPGFGLHRVGRFRTPVYVTAPPRDRHRVFVVEQSGRIRVIKDGRTLKRPFIDLRDRVRFQDEQGLFSMAFAPDYRRSHRFYVFYTDNAGDQEIEELRATPPDRATTAGARTVLHEDDPEVNHNGGQLQFGPDGKLYIANGDGGGEEYGLDAFGLAQDPTSPFGKVLRIDARTPGAAPEVYLSGLRNPWRFSFDRMTGDLVVTDVGRNHQDEVDFFPRGTGRGANLGWPAFEGDLPTGSPVAAPGAVRPTLVSVHAGSNRCAITGGYVSRDPRLPATRGRYLFGDLCQGDVLTTRLGRPSPAVRDSGLHVEELVSFGEDARARLYVVSRKGPVYRIVRR